MNASELKKIIKEATGVSISIDLSGQTWVSKCRKLSSLKSGKEFIGSDQKSDIYIVLSGMVAVGDRKGDFYVEKLILRKGSLLGETEASLKIDGIGASRSSMEFPHIFAQQRAWATSNVLSKTIAYSYKETTKYIPDDTTDKYRFLSDLIGESDHIYSGDQKELIEKDVLSNDVTNLLKIPEVGFDTLWEDIEFRNYVCLDAFIKSKKYWLLPHNNANNITTGQRESLRSKGLPGITKEQIDVINQIEQLFEHAKINNILQNDGLFLLGDERINAILDTRISFSVRQERNSIQEALKTIGLGFKTFKRVSRTRQMVHSLKEIKSDGSEESSDINLDDDLWKVYDFMSCSPTKKAGDNKNIYYIFKKS